MAKHHNPKISSSNLLLNVDFTSIKCYTPNENLLTYSSDLTNAAWGIHNGNSVVIASNVTTAPDGTLTADSVINNNVTTALYYQSLSTTITGVGQLISTVYAKAFTSTKFTFNSYYVGDTEVNVTFTLTGSGTTSDATKSTITALDNGWYKCTITTPARVNAGTTFNWRIWPGERSVTNNIGCYFWGASLEKGAYTNQYVPTTSSNSPRSVSVINTVGTNTFTVYNTQFVNNSSNFIQFIRTASTPKHGGLAYTTGTGSLTSGSFLYNDHTWEVWFRIDDVNPGGYGDATEARSCLLEYRGYHAGFEYNATNLFYSIWDSSGPTIKTCCSWTLGASGSQINQGSWYQLVVTRSGNIFTPYVNGVGLGTGSTQTFTSAYSGTSNDLHIGATANVASGAGSYLYYGKNSIANMKMYNRALSATEISQNFNALRGRFGI